LLEAVHLPSGGARAIGAELRRQQEHIELIASENIVSPAVLADRSALTCGSRRIPREFK